MSSTEFEKFSSFLLDCSASSPASCVARVTRSCAFSSCFSAASLAPTVWLCFSRACRTRSSARGELGRLRVALVAELLQLELFDVQLRGRRHLGLPRLLDLPRRCLDRGLRLLQPVGDTGAELLPGLLAGLLHLWPQLLGHVPADARHHRNDLDRAPPIEVVTLIASVQLSLPLGEPA
ncbi:hypothetical protein GS887_28180 [Rhodococcus hoagii]|nr:hypothetical protein [Prescottella equi]